MSKMSNLDMELREARGEFGFTSEQEKPRPKQKMHFRDIRLFNNAGMSFPTCRANDKMLNLEAAWLPITAEIHEVTCKHCLKAYRYNNPF